MNSGSYDKETKVDMSSVVTPKRNHDLSWTALFSSEVKSMYICTNRMQEERNCNKII